MNATGHHRASVGDGEAPGRRAALSSGISVRRERFGGLIYSFPTRQLRVVRSRPAIEVAIHLGAGESLEEVSSWLVEQRLALDRDSARAFVIATVERFQEMGIMSWTTN